MTGSQPPIESYLDNKFPEFFEITRFIFIAKDANRLPEALSYLKKNNLRSPIFNTPSQTSDLSKYDETIASFGFDKSNVLMVIDPKAASSKSDFSFKDKMMANATVFFLSDGSYQAVINKDGNDKSFKANYTDTSGCGVLRMLSEYISYEKNNNPAERIKGEIAKLKDEEYARKWKRKDSIPPSPSGFWETIEHIYRYCESREEFFDLTLGADSVDLSDRNRTRVGRAMLGLPDNKAQLSTAGSSRETAVIYRASPRHSRIEAGDWVTLSKSYAATHARAYNGRTGCGEDKLTISQKTVPASSVLWDGANDDEYFYVPSDLWGEMKNEDDLWNNINTERKPDSVDLSAEKVDKLNRKLMKLTALESGSEMTI